MAAFRTHAKSAFLTGRPRVQTQWVWGPHERRRSTIFAVKLGIFLALPWTGALQLDLSGRRFHVFGQVFWPQDLHLLGLVLAIAALLLFATAAIVGRVFCGHACPHTLLTSVFMLVDHWVEGDRPARLKFDAIGGFALRRALKHVVWAVIALGLGYTFASYFTGTPLWLAGLVAAVTYLFAGHLRDFVCTTACPYGRFQGAMADASSLVVAYDATRGEPRGKGDQAVARGGCVDCGMCVTACPMGIDIRQGLQYECITCARCIDACNHMMARIGAEPDLIRFAIEAAARRPVENPEALRLRPRDYWVWRPRIPSSSGSSSPKRGPCVIRPARRSSAPLDGAIMTYGHRVCLALALLFALGAGSVGALLAAARGMAANDLRVGKGHSKFPPQHVTRTVAP